MVVTRVVKWFSAGGNWFQNRSGRVVVSAPSLTDSDGVRYYDQAWLRKATDIVEGRRGNVN